MQAKGGAINNKRQDFFVKDKNLILMCSCRLRYKCNLFHKCISCLKYSLKILVSDNTSLADFQEKSNLQISSA